MAESTPARAGTIFSSRTPATGVSIPLFGHDKTKPAAQLHMGSVIVGAQRRGFFRVGILPELQGRNVEIVFSGDKIDPEALLDLSSALHTLVNTESAEFFNFSIRTAASSEAEIRSATAVIDADHDWELTQVIRNGGIPAAKARLVIHGNRAGQLLLTEDHASQSKNKP